jgi:hypothetical protein
MKLNIISVAGGLGNQMFQFAFYLSIKYRSKSRLTFLYIAPYKLHNGFELNYVFGIRKRTVLNLLIGFIKKSCKSKSTIIRDLNFGTFCLHDIDQNSVVNYFSGYWQSEKYFINLKSLVKSKFQFNLRCLSNKSLNILSVINSSNSVSVHIRKGDYESDLNAKEILGGNCSVDYFMNSINYIENLFNDLEFFFFSDDIEWVKNTFNNKKNIYYVDWNRTKDSWQDMLLMSKCKHNIIANSSFSWWAAWLNDYPDKIVIAPKKWFNTYPASDITPPDWIRL